MGEAEVDDDEKPVYPIRIQSTEVWNNPFDDIIPRTTPEERKRQKEEEERNRKEEEARKKPKGKK